MVPSTAQPQPQSQVAPEVWQRGTPPIHWVMFRRPSSDEEAYSWPLDNGDIVAYADTCCYPAGVPPIGSVKGINISGATVPVTNVNPTLSSTSVLERPMKIFHCAGNTQICALTHYFVYGPNQALYYGDNQDIPDATTGSYNSVWFTTCCNGSYIVYGNGGERHFYRIPKTVDHLSRIARTNDGNVWVTLQHAGTAPWILAKLTPASSKVIEYPFQFQNPAQLFVGPDGNVWFALSKTLYRIDAITAHVTRFSLPKTSNGYLATGPHDTIWLGYLESPSDQGLIETSDTGTLVGTFTCPETYCTPGTLSDQIQQLTEGPDGNIWFAFSNTELFNPNPPPDNDGGIGVYVNFSISISPASVTFTGPLQTATISFSEANYSGTFTAETTQPSIVRVVKFVTPHEVEIESVGLGSGRIIVRDTQNNYYGVNVTVR